MQSSAIAAGRCELSSDKGLVDGSLLREQTPGQLLAPVTTYDLQTMEFRIADTFTDSLARLTGDEQKAVKTTAFDLQLNPANPGMSFHKLDKAKDKNFWSVRVNATSG